MISIKIKVTDTIKNYKNEDAVDSEDKPTMIRDIFLNALNLTISGEPALTPDEKMKAFRLSLRLHAADEVDITVDEAALLKSRIGKMYNPLTYGRVCELLDGPQTT